MELAKRNGRKDAVKIVIGVDSIRQPFLLLA